MRYLMSGATTLSAVVLTAAMAVAQPVQAPKATKATHATPHATTVAMNERVLVGSIEKYDASTQALTVKTKDGTEKVVQIGPSTRINEGSKKLGVRDLDQLTGRHVKIRYQEQNGQMTADSIMVSGSVAKK
jgi:negative regulator of sigma E activity